MSRESSMLASTIPMAICGCYRNSHQSLDSLDRASMRRRSRKNETTAWPCGPGGCFVLPVLSRNIFRGPRLIELLLSDERCVEIGPTQICAVQVGIAQIRAAQVGPDHGSIEQVSVAEIYVAQVGPVEVAAAQVGPAHIRAGKYSPPRLHPDQARPAQISIAQVGIAQNDTSEFRFVQMRLDFGMLLSPLIPCGCALLEKIDMLRICHRLFTSC